MASNKHLQLPGHFGKHSMFEISDPLYSLLKIQNITKFHIWNNSKTEFTKLKSLSLPSYLLGLKEIPMQSFIHGMKTYKTVNVKDNTKNQLVIGSHNIDRACRNCNYFNVHN